VALTKRAPQNAIFFAAFETKFGAILRLSQLVRQNTDHWRDTWHESRAALGGFPYRK